MPSATLPRLLFAALLVIQAGAQTFTNPVVSSGADPWLVQQDGWYYFMATAGDRVDLRKSRTLAGLGAAVPVTLWKAPATGPASRSIWAPELHYVKDRNRWYVYFTATSADDADANRRIYALESVGADPLGPYVEKGRVAVPGDDQYAIDGTLLQQPGGRLFFLWSGRRESASGPQNIYLAPMSNPWTISGPRVLLSTPEHSWERHGWPVNEGPEVLQRDGKTFIIYSASGFTQPTYALGLLTNTNGDLLNPAAWSKSAAPVFRSHEGADGKVYGPGHNGFFRSPDGREDWIIYHARDTDAVQVPGRTARAQRFTWNADGSPNFGQPIPPGVALPVPAGEAR